MKRKLIMAGLFAGLLLAAGILLASCSKKEDLPCGGYSFGEIYLYLDGGMADVTFVQSGRRD